MNALTIDPNYVICTKYVICRFFFLKIICDIWNLNGIYSFLIVILTRLTLFASIKLEGYTVVGKCLSYQTSNNKLKIISNLNTINARKN